MFQQSVWITPYDVSEKTESYVANVFVGQIC